jgi:hypothetical protein
MTISTANRFHKVKFTWFAIDKVRRVVFGPYGTNREGASLAVQMRKISDPGKVPLDQSNVLLLDHLPEEYADWPAGDYAVISRENVAFDAKQLADKKAKAAQDLADKEAKKAAKRQQQRENNPHYIPSYR